MICPRCKKELNYKDVDDQKVEACMSCSGMWLKKSQLNALLSESGGDMESCSIDENPHLDKYPVIKCRDCNDVDLKKVNFLDYSEIILDYCPQCGGFWLDRDELAKMKVYIKKVEDGSHSVREKSAYHLLVKLSEMAYSLFK